MTVDFDIQVLAHRSSECDHYLGIADSAEFAEAPLHIRQAFGLRFLELGEAAFQFRQVDSRDGAAVPAGEIWIEFGLSESGSKCLAALAAGDFDGL